MIRSIRNMTLLAAGLAVLATGGSARAAFINGSDSFSTSGKISSDTGNINTAMMYTFAHINTSQGNGGGDFFTYTSADTSSLGTADILTLSSATTPTGTATFSYGDSTYGTFTAATFINQSTGPLTQAYYLTGTFTPGTDFPAADQGIMQQASLVISFTQNGSTISASGTLAVPPASVTSVPEPASLGMVALGLAGVAGVARFRRKSA